MMQDRPVTIAEGHDVGELIVVWLDSERERSMPCPRCSVKAVVAR